MLSPRADERAALVFEDLASAIDAGLPLETLGGSPQLGDHVLADLAEKRSVKLLPTERTVLEAGWRSGQATDALRGRAKHRHRRAEFRRVVRSKLSYPLVLLTMLPVAAVATSYVIGSTIAVIVGCVYAVLGLLVWIIARKVARGDGSLERWPIVGNLLEDVRELPYLETLHALYGAGVPIVEANRRATDAVQMQGLKDRLLISQNMLESGTTLRESLAQSVALSAETRSLITTAEQAGQLEDALLRAITRRQDVATRKFAAAATLIGRIAYALAVIGVVALVFTFYGRYFALLGV